MLDPTTRKVQSRRKKGLSVRQIAEETGVSKSTVHRLVSGPRFRKSLLEHQQEIGIRKARNEGDLSQGIAEATRRCREAMLEENSVKAGQMAKVAKDLAYAAKQEGDTARGILLPRLQAESWEEDPEFLRAWEMMGNQKVVDQSPPISGDLQDSAPSEPPPD